MLCLSLWNHTHDFRWPRGRALVVIGPTARDSAIRIQTPDGKHRAAYPLPANGGAIRVDVAGLSFNLVMRQRRDCRVALDLPPECEVVRRPREGRRAS